MKIDGRTIAGHGLNHRYQGPTPGERMEIQRLQVELARSVLLERGEVATVRQIDALEDKWKEWQSLSGHQSASTN